MAELDDDAPCAATLREESMADHPEAARLSTRQEWMLVQRAKGWTYAQIGEDHGVTASQVGRIMRQVRKVLGVSTDEEANAEMVRRSLLDTD